MIASTTNKLADRFRSMAGTMQKDIKHYLADRRQNTPKQQREANSARSEGHKLQRAQRALLALADAHEAGTCPEILQDVKTKSDIIDMMRTRIKATGYYEHVDTGEFVDTSPKAMALRQLVDDQASASDRAAAAEQQRLEKIRQLEGTVRNAKIDGFFPTPPSVAAMMFESSDYQDGGWVLEPSAGAGHLADAIKARYPNSTILCCERNYTLADIVAAKGYPIYRGDFLAEPPQPIFDAVFMNPPFEVGLDAEHIRHAHQFLKPGGELLSVASAGVTFRRDRKAVDFREWLEPIGEIAPLPDDAFAGRDSFRTTNVRTCLVRAIKPR